MERRDLVTAGIALAPLGLVILLFFPGSAIPAGPLAVRLGVMALVAGGAGFAVGRRSRRALEAWAAGAALAALLAVATVFTAIEASHLAIGFAFALLALVLTGAGGLAGARSAAQPH